MKTHYLTFPPNELLTWLYESERAHTSDPKLSQVFWYLSREKQRLVPSDQVNEDHLPPRYNVKLTERVY